MKQIIILLFALVFVSCSKEKDCQDDLRQLWTSCDSEDVWLYFYDDGMFEMRPLQSVQDTVIVLTGSYTSTCEEVTLSFETGDVDYKIESLDADLLELRVEGSSNIECWGE